ncbi:L-threonine 3-dehydrogenase [Labilithrix luteola]|uniref:L-threonine 3-dehydrogenase n=1 Tax=Labilithrix luteola TaxID=1391654 RepID=A0A0K1PQZ6_9BACT|nr:NAD-dependent epimerase/dehydratase family protein [Labilithrix luteola]AKU95796.1 L-threonine 3-dehydrogenase [Labilithrix luteola]
MSKPVVLVTGANGEIGRTLLQRLHAEGNYRVVTVDLTPLPEKYRQYCLETYAGNIMDRYLLDQVAAHHEIEVVFHLAALLSTRGERDPELAHQVNVEGTLHLLRVAQNQSQRLGRPVRFIFPSSIAVYGMPSVEEKTRAGAVVEDAYNTPITMYGCNKLYCEHLGRYFTNYFRQLGALANAARLDFRSIRFPGLISAETVPTGGTSDFGPEMLHAAAQGQAYKSFVGPDARIPFMAMPDAVTALLTLLEADREKLTDTVYNVTAFSPTAGQIADRVRKAFPGADITFEPDAVRSKIVDSWPADMDDSRARKDWGWKPAYDVDRAFDEYLIPTIRKRYAESR